MRGVLQVQEEQLMALPDRIDKSAQRANNAMNKLKALQSLHPEWTRLEKLKNTVVRAAEAQAKELEIEVASKAHHAGELHEQRHELDSVLQVFFLLQT